MTTFPLPSDRLLPSLVSSAATLPRPHVAPYLTPAHFQEIELAHRRAKKIRRAAAVATLDAWISSIFAGLTIVSAIFSPTSLILGAALAAIAFNSFRGAKGLRNFNPKAARWLAYNQLALAVTLIIYAAISLWNAAYGPSELTAAANSAGPDVTKSLGNWHLDQLYWLLNLAIYGGLIVGTVFAQGLTAIYYATRAKHVRAYFAATPPWVLELQKAQLAR